MLQKHAPIKKTYIWANQAPLMSNKIEKEIMRRTHLIKKKKKKKWTNANRVAYNKQHYYCVSHIRRKKDLFQ